MPGGNVDPGEPVHQALARELDEKLGLDLTDASGVPQ
ncbi:NUDIX domain-containing protein [Streptomyces purpurascens]|nr:NUDIX domain-containing protein [Streptomyces purpurascens]